MGGKSAQTIGYRYRHLLFEIWAQHVDVLHRFVAGGKQAWTGCVHENQTIQIDAPAIWGDDEDNGEGGMVGPMDVQFGLADQAVNARMTTILGPRQTGNRGWFSTVFEGIFGSYVPNPKTRSVLLERIHAGWPGEEAWYPETAAIPLVEGTEGSPGTPGSGAGGEDYYNMGLRVESVYAGVDQQAKHTLEMCEYYALDYTPSSEYYAFWRPNESGLYYIKFAGDSNETAVLDLVSRGWQIDEVALCKFNSGELLACVIRLVDEAPYAPAGREWAMDPVPISTDLGSVYLFMAELANPGIEPTPPVAATCAPRAMNPAHIIRYMLTQKKQIPDAMLSDASFEYAADVLFAEGFGLCEEFDPDQETPEAFILRICDIIGACCTQSKTDGLIYLDLLRNDYDKETLPELTDDDIVDWQDEQAVPAELTNSVQIGWRDVLIDGGLERITPPIKALGHIRTHGREMNQVIDMRGIPFEGIAMRVAKRELDARSKPLVRLTITAHRKHTSLRPGQPLLINCPKRGRVDMVVRVGEVDHGTPTDGRMRWVLLQDVFDLPTTVEIDPTTVHDPNDAPADADAEIAIEAPFVELVATLNAEQMAAVGEEAGYLLTGVTAPTRGTNYAIHSKLASEAYERRAFADFTPSALTFGDALPLDTAVDLVSGNLLSRVEVGSWALWEDEIIRVDGIDGDGILTMGRGCADTVPAAHAAGTRIMFLGDWNGTDRREYASGDELAVKLPVRTGPDEQDLADKTELEVTFAQRQFRPYPPGNLMLNGEPFYGSGAVVVSPPGGGGGGGGGGGVPEEPPPDGSGAPYTGDPLTDPDHTASWQEGGAFWPLMVGVPVESYLDGRDARIWKGSNIPAVATGQLVPGVYGALLDGTVGGRAAVAGVPLQAGTFTADVTYPSDLAAEQPHGGHITDSVTVLPDPDFSVWDMRWRGTSPGSGFLDHYTFKVWKIASVESLDEFDSGKKRAEFDVQGIAAGTTVVGVVCAYPNTHAAQGATVRQVEFELIADAVVAVEVDATVSPAVVNLLDASGAIIDTATIARGTGQVFRFRFGSTQSGYLRDSSPGEYVTCTANFGELAWAITASVGFTGLERAPAEAPMMWDGGFNTTLALGHQGRGGPLFLLGTSSFSGSGLARSQIGKSSGLWRMRFYLNSRNPDVRVGLCNGTHTSSDSLGGIPDTVGYKVPSSEDRHHRLLWDGGEASLPTGFGTGQSGQLNALPTWQEWLLDFTAGTVSVYIQEVGNQGALGPRMLLGSAPLPSGTVYCAAGAPTGIVVEMHHTGIEPGFDDIVEAL